MYYICVIRILHVFKYANLVDAIPSLDKVSIWDFSSWKVLAR